MQCCSMSTKLTRIRVSRGGTYLGNVIKQAVQAVYDALHANFQPKQLCLHAECSHTQT